MRNEVMMRNVLLVIIAVVIVLVFLEGAVLGNDSATKPLGVIHNYIILLILFVVFALVVIFWNYSLRKAIKAKSRELEENHQENLRINDELSTRKSMLQLVFDNSPIGMAMRDMTRDGKLIDVNKAYADMLGYTLEEMRAGEFEKVYYLPDIEASEKKFRELMDGAPSVKIDKRLTKKDGSLIHIRQRMVLIRDSKQKPLILLGMSVDVTEQVKLEKQLKENDMFYKSVLKNMSGIVYNCAFDDNYTMLYISPGIKEIAGYDNVDLINNKNSSFHNIIYPEDRKMVRKIIRRAVEQKSIYNLEYRIIHKNNGLVWVYEEGRGIYDDQGELQHLNGTIIDINDRKLWELQLKENNEEMETKVMHRTQDLEAQYKKLERVNRLFVGRELRIRELKDKVKELNREIERLKK